MGRVANRGGVVNNANDRGRNKQIKKKKVFSMKSLPGVFGN